MTKTKIEWCSMSWSPITGCLHNCEYCYARGIAKRFEGFDRYPNLETCGWSRYSRYNHSSGNLYKLDNPFNKTTKTCKTIKAPYPFGFAPTFHRYRLDDPQKIKKPQTIFVGSMADMFGEWVSDEWIEEVFKACKNAHWHRYLFLTKNSKRYEAMRKQIHYLAETQDKGVETWLGTTITKPGDEYSSMYRPFRNIRCFLSIEPMQEQISVLPLEGISWIIIGAETKNGKVVNPPKREWITDIAHCCAYSGVPVFMKNSLREIMGDAFIQEFPWEV